LTNFEIYDIINIEKRKEIKKMKHCKIYFDFDFEEYYSSIIEEYVDDGDSEGAEKYTKILVQLREYSENGADFETLEQLDDILDWLGENLEVRVGYDGEDIICEG
jgi:hypothetical protein